MTGRVGDGNTKGYIIKSRAGVVSLSLSASHGGWEMVGEVEVGDAVRDFLQESWEGSFFGKVSLYATWAVPPWWLGVWHNHPESCHSAVEKELLEITRVAKLLIG